MPFYIHEVEFDIRPKELPKGKRMIRYCESPMFSAYPGCVDAYSSYEVEEVYGTVKHEPEQRWYKRPKLESVVTCRQMPLEYCLRLIDTDEMTCPHCKCKLNYKEGIPNGISNASLEDTMAI